MIDSCPPEKGLTEVTAGLSTLPGCPRLWPHVIPRASQTLPPAHGHMSSSILFVGYSLPHRSGLCLVISRMSVKPTFSPRSMSVSCYYNAAQCYSTLTFLFPFSLIILFVYSHPNPGCVCVCVYMYLCVSPSLSSNGAARWFVSRRCQSNSCGSPDTSLSVSSVEARGNEALPIY